LKTVKEEGEDKAVEDHADLNATEDQDDKDK
jgi:hypothetical protein